MTDMDGTRPRLHRQPTLKGGTILRGINASEVTCSIRNMHEGGAELRVHLTSIIPNEFLLYVPVDRFAYRAVPRWRKGERLGVMFTGTEPKPS